jgi:hypothetical protein
MSEVPFCLFKIHFNTCFIFLICIREMDLYNYKSSCFRIPTFCIVFCIWICASFLIKYCLKNCHSFNHFIGWSEIPLPSDGFFRFAVAVGSQQTCQLTRFWRVTPAKMPYHDQRQVTPAKTPYHPPPIMTRGGSSFSPAKSPTKNWCQIGKER